jgi:hypothetical protein
LNRPAHILLLVSDPLDAAISIERDLTALQDALRDLDAAAVFETRAAEAKALQDHLERGDRPRYSVLHYLGHGYKPPQSQNGYLIFESRDGAADPLDVTRLAIALSGWVSLLDQGVGQGGQATGVFIARFNAELPSIESWLDWAYERETAKNNRARAPRLTASLQDIYAFSNVLHRKHDRLDRALACAMRCADKEGEAYALWMMGNLLMRVADLGGARALRAGLADLPRDRRSAWRSLRASGNGRFADAG